MKRHITFTALLILVLSMAATAAPGDLDTTFGIQGKLQDSTLASISATVVQQDGKIVVVGSKCYISSGCHYYPAIARYNADGSLDYGFGTEGWIFGTMNYGSFNAVVLQSDGKLVAAGGANAPGDNYPDSFIVRLNTNGTFDTTFSGDGKLSFSHPSPEYFDSHMTCVALVPGSNKILLAGTVRWDPWDSDWNSSDIFLARFNPDGTFDASFGNGDILGRQTLDIVYQGSDTPTSMAVHPTSKKIALSLMDYYGEQNVYGDFKVALLNENGSFDTNFGGTGYVTTDFNGYADAAESVAFQRWLVPSGGYFGVTTRIVVGGSAYGSSITEKDFALARYSLNGTLDTGFDGDGKVRKSLSYQDDQIRGMRIDSAARIVTAGPRRWNSVTDFAVVRFTKDGAFDPTFGTQGKVYTQFFSNGIHLNAEPTSLALAPDGKIVVAGGPYSWNEKLFARYEP